MAAHFKVGERWTPVKTPRVPPREIVAVEPGRIGYRRYDRTTFCSLRAFIRWIKTWDCTDAPFVYYYPRKAS